MYYSERANSCYEPIIRIEYKSPEHICDALRYCLYSAFPDGLLNHPDENITAEQLKKNIFQDQDFLGIGDNGSGYM